MLRILLLGFAIGNGTAWVAVSFIVAKKPLSIEIVQEGDERFVLRTFANGETTREPIVKSKRKKRYPDRPYWHWDLSRREKKDE